MHSSYITSAQKAQQLPQFGLPEVCFIGRSNCGKSSLLNALLERKNLARTSQTPGRTQMVNFFRLDRTTKTEGLGEQLIFADLPGYGYSAIGHEARRHWQHLLDAYFKRPSLAQALFLIDIRRIATLDQDDIMILRYLIQTEKAVTIICTKADKLSQKDQSDALKSLSKALATAGILNVPSMAISSLKGKGLKELRSLVVTPYLQGQNP